MSGTVSVESDRDNHVARITFDNPEKKNALSLDMVAQLGTALDEIAVDDDIKVVLLRGVGGVFTTGADLSQAYDWYAKPGESRRPSQRRRLTVDRSNLKFFSDFVGYPKVTISQVEGYAFGLGLELAIASDITVIAADALIGMPATRFLGPVLGNIQLFFYRLGPAIARDLLLTGRQAAAGEYAQAGVFARTVAPETVAAVAEGLVEQVARMPADGIGIAKEAYRLIESTTGMAGQDVSTYLFHAFGTNLRFEPDEFNFVKERAHSGSTTAAFRRRDEFYEPESQ